MGYSLGDQIREVKREIALRRNVYAKQIARGHLAAEQAERQLALMLAVLESLEGLQAGAQQCAEAAMAQPPGTQTVRFP